MPDPDPASPSYINGWRSRIFANAASGMTPFLDQSHFYSNDFMSPREESTVEIDVKSGFSCVNSQIGHPQL